MQAWIETLYEGRVWQCQCVANLNWKKRIKNIQMVTEYWTLTLRLWEFEQRERLPESLFVKIWLLCHAYWWRRTMWIVLVKILSKILKNYACFFFFLFFQWKNLFLMSFHRFKKISKTLYSGNNVCVLNLLLCVYKTLTIVNKQVYS